MDEAEHSRYVAQLRAEFDRCDTTATGFLDRDELTELFRRLQLDAHLELLLDALLGERPYGRVTATEGPPPCDQNRPGSDWSVCLCPTGEL